MKTRPGSRWYWIVLLLVLVLVLGIGLPLYWGVSLPGGRGWMPSSTLSSASLFPLSGSTCCGGTGTRGSRGAKRFWSSWS
jgi:hypothetical protein